MDGTELLKQDHDKVKQLFDQVEAAKDPAIAKFKELEPLLKDAYTEHANAKLEMGKIANTPSSTPQWRTEVSKLHKDILHHVKDEEEKMFPQVRKVMNEQQLEELGQELSKAKKSNLSSELLSQPGPLTMAGGAQQFA